MKLGRNVGKGGICLTIECLNVSNFIEAQISDKAMGIILEIKIILKLEWKMVFIRTMKFY